MARYGSEAALKRLAEPSEKRQRLLAERRKRSASRARVLTCRSCGDTTYSHRDRTDICDECLITLWGFQNAREEADKLEADGVQQDNVWKMTSVDHWLPYPYLSGGYRRPPADAIFAKDEMTDGRLFQRLFHELVAAIARVMPAPQALRGQAQTFLSDAGAYDGGLYFVASKDLIDALRALWVFVPWASSAAYAEGHEDGRNLLKAMASGAGESEFNAAVERQTAAMRKADENSKKPLGAAHRS